MTAPKPTIVADRERIIAVVPEYCNGPGWANSVLWVYIVGDEGTLRTECLHPHDRTAEMDVLFPVLNAAHGTMLKLVEMMVNGEKK